MVVPDGVMNHRIPRAVVDLSGFEEGSVIRRRDQRLTQLHRRLIDEFSQV
jgi:hypothetical protein